jgi:predicted PurR-regulated permease PerM
MEEMEPLPRRWSSQTKIAVSLVLLALLIFLLWRFRVVVRPLVIAFILAYILSPVATYFQRRQHIGRGVATLEVYMLLLLVATILPLSILPLLATQYADLEQDTLQLIDQARGLLGHPFQIAGQVYDGAAIFQQISLSLNSLIQPIFGQTLGLLVEVISSIVWIVFIVVVSFYLIKDGPSFQSWVENSLPSTFRADFVRLRNEINEIWSAFFRGELILALVVSIMITLVGFLIGLPFALAMGVLAGLLEFLPSIGHGIWLITASLVALFAGSNWLPIPNWAFMVLVIILHLIFEQFDLNYLIPRIIGQSVHLPPLVVILGIVLGATAAGVLGIPLAAPTIASGRVLGRYIYAHLFDLDLAPEYVATHLPAPNPYWWRVRHNIDKTPVERESETEK